MALNTLKDVKEIEGFTVMEMGSLKSQYPEKFNESGSMDYEWFESEIRPKNFIYVRHDVNSISFVIQNGPVKEAGINGCQLTALISTAKIMLEKLNENYPCDENSVTIRCLAEALYSQELRTKNREARNVEGTNQI